MILFGICVFLAALVSTVVGLFLGNVIRVSNLRDGVAIITVILFTSAAVTMAVCGGGAVLTYVGICLVCFLVGALLRDCVS